MDHDEITRDKALLMMSDVLSKLTIGDLNRGDANKLHRALLDEVNRLAEQRKKRKESAKLKFKVLPPSPTLGMMTPWNTLNLPNRIYQAIALMGVDLMRDFVQKTEQDLLGCRNIGPASIRLIVQELARCNWRLGMTAAEVARSFGPDPRKN